MRRLLFLSCCLPILACDPQASPARPPLVLDSGWEFRIETAGENPADFLQPTGTGWSAFRPGENLYQNDDPERPFAWLRYRLPAELAWEEPFLMISNHLGLYEIYAGDRLLLRTGPSDPQAEFGNRVRRYWPITALPARAAGETIYLRISLRGPYPARTIKPPLLGDRHELRRILMLSASNRTLPGIFFCTLAFFVLVVFVFRRESLYLSFAVLAFSMGLYTISDQELAYYFSGLSSSYYDIPQLTLAFLPVGLVAFIENILGAGPWKFVRRLWQFYLVFAALMFALVLGGIAPRWDLLKLFLAVVSPLVVLVPGMALYRSFQAHSTEARIFTVGLLIFSATMARDIFVSRNVYTGTEVIFHWGGLALVLALALIVVRRFFDAQHQLELHARDLERTNLAMARFVPTPFLEFIGRSRIVDVRLGDQAQKEMTVLFTDIRSFTTLSESMTPGENFDFINAYLRHMGPVIRRHNGFIDKYIGDAIMALFPGSPDDALNAAREMRARLAEFNDERERSGRPPVEMGIGVHTGLLMLGMVGEEERIEGTVIADAVNLASRLEGLTKKLPAAIIFSEAVRERLAAPERFDFRYLGRARVKGKREPVRIYECSAAHS